MLPGMAEDDDGPLAASSGTQGAIAPSVRYGLASGTRVGRYIVVRRASPLGTGDTYVAFDPELDRKVLLKLMVVYDEVEPVLERLEVLPDLAHPNVARIYEVGSYDDGVFVAMAFVEGLTVRQWMEARDDPFPWREVLRVFRAAGRGLAAAHRRGILHTDFRPDSILLEQRGGTLVLDFGVLRPSEEAIEGGDLDLTPFHDALQGVLDGEVPPSVGPQTGTPAYQAPEHQVGQAPDAAADQYAFCVAFYEVLYGERPFSGTLRSTLLTEQLTHDVRPAPAGSDVPSWLREVLLKGLLPRPSDRHASMEALLGALDRDPVSRRRRWMKGSAMLGLTGLLVGGMGFLAYSEARRCEPDETLLDGIWDAGTRAVLRERFEASEEDYAAKSWQTVETRLDEWSNEWLELRSLACTMTHVRKAASQTLLEERRACLDSRLSEVAAFVELYQDASPLMLENATAAAMAIPRPRSCVSPASLKTHAAPPERLRVAVETLRQSQNRAWVAYHSGDEAQAEELAATVARALPEVHFSPLHASNLLLRAALERGRAPGLAIALLHEASARAESHDLQQPAARAWIELATFLPDLQAATYALEHAEHAVAQAGSSRLDAALVEARGDLAARGGQLGVALSAYRETLETLEKDSDSDPFAKVRVHIKLGHLLAQRSELVAAQRYFERAIVLLSELLGSAHPSLSIPHEGLGQLARAAGDLDLAHKELERALDLMTQAPSAKPVQRAKLEHELADLELELGEPNLAGERMRRTLAILSRPGMPTSARVDALHTAAKIDLLLERPDTARKALEEAIELESRPQLQELLAQTLWETGDLVLRDRALELASTARDRYAEASSDEDTARVDRWIESHRGPLQGSAEP